MRAWAARRSRLRPRETSHQHWSRLSVEPGSTHLAGMRSAKACEYLTSLGFENVVNVTGGMDAFQKL